MTPAIRALREGGVEQIDLVLGSRTRELFEHHPFVREIFTVDRDRLASQPRGRTLRELAVLLGRLRKNRYDLFFDFSLQRHYAFLAFLVLNIPKRIGFDYKNRGFFLTDKLRLPHAFAEKHVAEYHLDLIRQAGFSPASTRFEFHLADTDDQNADKTLQALSMNKTYAFLVAGPGGGESWGKDARLKRWPTAYFAELIRKILADPAGPKLKKVLILGGQAERSLGDALAASLAGIGVNFCGELPLRTSAALIKRAALVVANDGGLVHIASAFGTPTVAFYGPVDPNVYGPYPASRTALAVVNDGPECRPCYQNFRYNSACQHVDCLNTLTPEKVWHRIQQNSFIHLLKENHVRV